MQSTLTPSSDLAAPSWVGNNWGSPNYYWNVRYHDNTYCMYCARANTGVLQFKTATGKPATFGLISNVYLGIWGWFLNNASPSVNRASGAAVSGGGYISSWKDYGAFYSGSYVFAGYSLTPTAGWNESAFLASTFGLAFAATAWNSTLPTNQLRFEHGYFTITHELPAGGFCFPDGMGSILLALTTGAGLLQSEVPALAREANRIAPRYGVQQQIEKSDLSHLWRDLKTGRRLIVI